MPDVKAVLSAFKPYEKIALAVSGGSDSTALMLMASEWSGKITVLTVDHNLRDASRHDAEQTAIWADRLGLDCEILTWQHDNPKSAIQEKARQARYQLMGDWCRANGAGAIITAHTRNDQFETFVMRLHRASGIRGLGAMAPETTVDGIDILRPLLDVTREQLQDYLKSNNHGWLDDPSNHNRIFERVRIRQDKPLFPDAEIVALSARRLRRADRALEDETNLKMVNIVRASKAGYCLIDLAGFTGLADEFAIRILHRCIQWAGSNSQFLSMASLEQLVQWISSDNANARTLGGAHIARRANELIIGREAGRITSTIELTAGSTKIWDNRFCVTNNSDALVTISQTGNKAKRPDIPGSPYLPHFVHCALPAVYSDSKLVHIPFYQSHNDVSSKILNPLQNAQMHTDLSR